MEKIRYKVKTRSTRIGDRANYSSAQTRSLFMLMNSAPAELMHLFTSAAVQPWSSVSRDDKIGVASALLASGCVDIEKKKPPCLKKIRQDGLIFAVRSSAYLVESASHF